MTSNYTLKKEIEDFKMILKDYFRKRDNIITLGRMVNDFELSMDELNFLEYCLSELVEENWVERKFFLNHFEYKAAKKLKKEVSFHEKDKEF